MSNKMGSIVVETVVQKRGMMIGGFLFAANLLVMMMMSMLRQPASETLQFNILIVVAGIMLIKLRPNR